MIFINGIDMPTGDSFLGVRINSDGTVLIPFGMGNCTVVKAEHGEPET